MLCVLKIDTIDMKISRIISSNIIIAFFDIFVLKEHQEPLTALLPFLIPSARLGPALSMGASGLKGFGV